MGQRIKQTSGQELVLPRGRLRETNRALEECHAYIRLIPVGGEADRCRGTGLDGEDSGAVSSSGGMGRGLQHIRIIVT